MCKFVKFEQVLANIYEIAIFYQLFQIHSMYGLAGRPYISLIFLQLLKAHNIVNVRPNILKLCKINVVILMCSF
jgi:hypothetical protein